MRRKFAILVIVVIVTIMILLGFYYLKKRTRNVIERFAESKVIINILITGSNVYNDNKHRFYSIMSFNPENSKIGLTFIPPSFRVDLDGREKRFQRIDEIDINEFKKLSAFFSRNLKIKIPFYVVLYSPDVERIVDLLGGIELYTLSKAKDIYGIKFGLNYFDGEKIMKYINNTEENSIFEKYDRVQDILLTLYSCRDKYTKYFNPEFLSELKRTIKTNLLPQEIISLSRFLYSRESDIICTILPGSFNDNGFYCLDDIAYKIYEKEFLRRLVWHKDIDQPIKLKILNGTDIPGLAKKMRNLFVREGFNVVEFGTSPFPLVDKTIIINRKGDTAVVRKVSEFLGVNRIYHIVNNSELNNVLLIIGKDLSWERSN